MITFRSCEVTPAAAMPVADWSPKEQMDARLLGKHIVHCGVCLVHVSLDVRPEAALTAE